MSKFNIQLKTPDKFNINLVQRQDKFNINLVQRQGPRGPIGPQGETGPEAVVESLSDIIDVTIVGPKDGDKVEYDGLANLWRNRREDKNPVYTYAAGVLTRVDYASGNYKSFSYSGGRLSQLQYVLAGRTVTKVFSYNLDGTLASISQTEVYN